MQRSVAVLFLTLVFAGSVLAGPTGVTVAEYPGFSQPAGFESTTFEITVYEDSDARWTFEHRRPLDNETAVQRFRDFAREFETNESALYRDFVERSRSLTALGSDATGRNMTAIDHGRSASVREMGQRQGVVRLSFTWTNFAVREEGRLVVGDVFDGGIPIGENQRLEVRTGPNLTFASADPADYSASGETLASSDSITWFGERYFADNKPRVEFQSGPPGEPRSSGTGSNAILFVGLVIVAFVLVSAIAYRRGVLDQLHGWSPTTDDDGDTAGTDDAGSGPDPPDVPAIVSDRDRVTELLSENGGRMKQVRIVEETDWSKSKVSMLLSEMEEDGEISKLRVGRENIVSLAGHEPDAAGSPFDDE